MLFDKLLQDLLFSIICEKAFSKGRCVLPFSENILRNVIISALKNVNLDVNTIQWIEIIDFSNRTLWLGKLKFAWPRVLFDDSLYDVLSIVCSTKRPLAGGESKEGRVTSLWKYFPKRDTTSAGVSAGEINEPISQGLSQWQYYRQATCLSPPSY